MDKVVRAKWGRAIDIFQEVCEDGVAFVALVKPLEILEGLQVQKTCEPPFFWLEAVAKSTK
jgi:cold shock protein